ncbi:hypothetical protein RND81_01G119000 [Saponaria officinalis]|uniref:Cation/H+ exchanger domain-containing protein n=1 Tax=Saponaria officinalis TaxID=3572 RepID=A0AAW1NEJ8_SAPOF
MMNNTTEEKYIDRNQETCMTVPPWFPRSHWPLVEFPFITLQLQMIVIFCLTQAIHRLFFKRLGIPPLLSQLLAGIVLSPTGNSLAVAKVRDLIFPPASEEVTAIISMLGFGLSLFMTAVKMDFTMIKRTGKKPIIIGLSVLLITGVTTSLVAITFVSSFLDFDKNQGAFSDFSATASLTALIAFPVIGVLLTDLNLLNSKLGRLAVSSGMICDITSITFNMASKTLSSVLKNGHDKTKLQILTAQNFLLVLLILIAMFVLRYFLKWMIKGTPKGRPVNERYLILVFALMLMGGLVTNVSGQFVLLGFFAVGAAIPEGPPLGSGIVDKFDFLVSDMLQPFFITTSAMKAYVFDVELRGVFALGRHLIVLSAYVSKFLVCLVFGSLFNMELSDTLALSAIMSSKGFVDVGNFVMFRQSLLIEEETYSYLILVTTIASFVVPLSVKYLYNPLKKYAGYEKRCIMHSTNDDPELRVVACIFRPDNVSAITNLLVISSPSKANPMIVDVLQLIRLAGRAQPVFVSHDLQQTKSSDKFEDIIWAFNSFKQAYTSNTLSMSFFTAVSPAEAMHDDVCTLALDKMASVIILPFHRKLNIDGHIDVDDHFQRVLNKSLLEDAPCSVGILVDRGNKKLTRSTSVQSTPLSSIAVQQMDDQEEILKVAVIFIGGKDDQEAVSYGKRIANKGVKVQVIRLMAVGEENQLTMADCWVLPGSRERDMNGYESHIKYEEQKVKDGPETVKYIWSIVENYDLMIVGRRVGEGQECAQTSGLQGWSEIPELGVLGDLLAQPDLKCRTSILVLQQQQQWTFSNRDLSFRAPS